MAPAVVATFNRRGAERARASDVQFARAATAERSPSERRATMEVFNFILQIILAIISIIFTFTQ